MNGHLTPSIQTKNADMIPIQRENRQFLSKTTSSSRPNRSLNRDDLPFLLPNQQLLDKFKAALLPIAFTGSRKSMVRQPGGSMV